MGAKIAVKISIFIDDLRNSVFYLGLEGSPNYRYRNI